MSAMQGSLINSVVSIRACRLEGNPFTSLQRQHRELCLLHLSDLKAHLINDKTSLKSNYRDTEKGQISAGSYGQQ